MAEKLYRFLITLICFIGISWCVFYYAPGYHREDLFFPIPIAPPDASHWYLKVKIGIGLVISTVLTWVVSGFVVWILKRLIRYGAIDP